MSNFTRIFESRAYKRTMSYVYGWGASLVIAGALFKIMHWPGAGLMLTIGMTTEAIIFFLSAFEPLHVEPDWSLVYPELWGLYHPEEAEKEGWKPQPKKYSESGKDSLTQKLDKMLEEAKIGPDLIQSLAEGMRNLSENANKLSGVVNAVTATDNFVVNLNKASESVQSLAGVYQQTAESLKKTADVNETLVTNAQTAAAGMSEAARVFSQISNTLQHDVTANEELVNNIKNAAQAAQLLTQKYQLGAEAIAKASEALDFSKLNPSLFSEQLGKITQNLAALNAIYEAHNQQVKEQVEKSKNFSQSVESFTRSVDETTQIIQAYKEQAALLAKNLAALNTIYGNMLAAMNINRS